MAKQRVVAGKELDIPTFEEMAEVFQRPYERLMISLGGSDGEEEIRDDTPTKGTRAICTSFSRGGGSDNAVIQALTLTKLCDFRPGRLAGTIQNIGANDAYAYLAPLLFCQRLQNSSGITAGINGVIVGFLKAGTGVFDFKLTNDVWGGPVTIWSQLGTTLVWGEH